MPRGKSTPLPQPVFNEGNLTLDPKQFKVKHPSDTRQYKEIEKLLTKDVVAFEPSRGQASDLYTFESAMGPHGAEAVQAIQKAGKLFFIAPETPVRRAKANTETSCVYRTTFVIPGTAPADTPLTIFMRNFCAQTSAITQEAASPHRTAMTQPGVYFSPDAPFVRIIGLFSNALEDPGVISSESGKWAAVPDYQLQFLTVQLQRIKKGKYAGAVLLAVHHPPFCYSPGPKATGTGGDHSGSPNMLQQIDALCNAQGVYPHAVLSGHAHNYQRFTRTIQFGSNTIDVPFIICGDGGHDLLKLVQGKSGQPAQEPQFGVEVDYLEPAKPAVQAKSLVLNHYDDTNYGYLRIAVDKTSLKIGFHQVGKSGIAQSRVDMVTVGLAGRTVVANA
jgi:hypothetical protein